MILIKKIYLMLKSYFFLFVFFLIKSFPIFAQDHQQKQAQKKAFENMVDAYLSYSIPVVNVHFVKNNLKNLTILDAREKTEYDVSHIPMAYHIGYDNFEISKLPKNIDKNQKIVVYCSIGYRSEKIGEKLKKAGFKNVYNLYGSLFDWANNNYPLVDKNGTNTSRIHGFNKKWSKWITNQNLEIVTD